MNEACQTPKPFEVLDKQVYLFFNWNEYYSTKKLQSRIHS